MGYRIGIDVGGTFTDLVYLRPDGAIGVVKTPSTPDDQARGVIHGLERLAAREELPVGDLLAATELIIHGTTVATNAMLELTGARTGLIATRGFRDDIEIRRGYKERIFDPRYPGPPPIARRRHRLTVDERVDRDGQVCTPLDVAGARAAVRQLKDAGVESIAVCLFFGFLNPVHERAIADLVRVEHPAAFLSLAHEVLPQIREFERVSTTLVNAYTGPLLQRYLTSLHVQLTALGFPGAVYVMLSNGGIMNGEWAGTYPVHTLLSGPAGGVVACAELIGDQCGRPDLITVDMGGTSYDVALIRAGRPALSTDRWFSRYRVAVPMLDIHTIGAGGGSIAWVDAGGALRVGPQSAGAVPGPACYGRGGRAPTVTDANLLLGFLDPDNFLGGEMRLDRAAAEGAVEAGVASPLGLDVVQAAHGIFRIVNANMANGIRVVSVQRGHDPRDFALVAFGGNGAVHAGMQARELGISTVIVPRLASAFSARGMLNSNIVVSTMRTHITRSDRYDLGTLNALLAAMRVEVDGHLPVRRTGASGPDMPRYRTAVDMHYRGETHEITVPLADHAGPVTAADVAGAAAAFHAAHERLHTFCNRGDPVHLMNLRLEAVLTTPKPGEPSRAAFGEDPAAARRPSRRVWFEEAGGFTDTPIFDGPRLRCGNVVPGPAVIEEPTTTIVVYPGHVARLTPWDHYEIRAASADAGAER